MPIERDQYGNITITGKEIKLARLLSLRGALRLEMQGFTRAGRSANTIACELLGLRKGTNRETTLARLEEAIDKWKIKISSQSSD